MTDLAGIAADLALEHGDLDRTVAGIDEKGWLSATPAEGWDVRDQIGHLAFFDEQATLAVSDPSTFTAGLSDIIEDVDGFVNRPLERTRALAPTAALDWWRIARREMLKAFDGLDEKARIPWYGPPMSSASFITARLMETWAHGQDIYDALGLERGSTERLRHVAHIGVRARPNSYAARGLDLPEGIVRVDLRGPNGDIWSWGEYGDNRVSGDALDFCLVVTQRRHVADTHLLIEGPLAAEWMDIAQAFAGPPGAGRRPGQFPKTNDR
jgi:uncharacterized protein (TIGR03084 family)